MTQIYKISKGMAVAGWILLPGLLALFVWMGVFPHTEPDFDSGGALFLTLLSIVLSSLVVIGMIDMVKSKVVIDEEKIVSTSVFKTKSLALSAVKGFRVDKNYLYFIPVSDKDKKINVSSYVGKYSQLEAWCNDNLKNLDLEELVIEEQKILEDETFGGTVEERAKKLERARLITKWLNIASWVVGMSFLIYPEFYTVQIILCGIFPLAGLLVYWLSNGLIRFDQKPNSAHPNVLATLYIPSLALVIRGFVDYQIFDYSNLWKPASGVFLLFVFFVVFDLRSRYDMKKAGTYLTVAMLFVFGAMYSVGLISTTNVAFDNSDPALYDAEVLDKRYTSGKTTTYYLKLGAWGPQTEVEEVSVAQEVYEMNEVGDTALVYFSGGLYRIPYYLVID